MDLILLQRIESSADRAESMLDFKGDVWFKALALAMF